MKGDQFDVQFTKQKITNKLQFMEERSFRTDKRYESSEMKKGKEPKGRLSHIRRMQTNTATYKEAHHSFFSQ
jgi:hypothetical protein